ncbi:signal peptidase I [Brevibacterium jeotgali]|uniref:Signal peptidase I n=1 Tax=Brevibacterium jeotgali TaxID=1262550 RepID=A0A2H1L4E3_9MICO|nr:signal peptidase I [Brevibacterium jeotgali]SMY11273.1 signal peptidase I [Brevibacterium jeotgali]
MPGGKKSLWGTLREFAIIIIIALVVSWVLKTFVVRSFHIPSASMEQTLQIGDRVMVNQLFFNDVERGDVVVFDDPGGWLGSGIAAQYEPNPALVFVGLQPADAGTQLIKRVIGLGGDTVECCDDAGRLMVNGEPIDESAYLQPGVSPSDVPFSVHVPEDHVWVMGDNRSNSLDSRYNADAEGGPFVADEDLVGEVFVINWPMDRLRWMGGDEGAYDSVPDAEAS